MWLLRLSRHCKTLQLAYKKDWLTFLTSLSVLKGNDVVRLQKLRLAAAHKKPRLGDARRDGASQLLISRRGRLGDALKASKKASSK